MLKRYDRTGFIPPVRPRRWKKKAFKALDEAVVGRWEQVCSLELRELCSDVQNVANFAKRFGAKLRTLQS